MRDRLSASRRQTYRLFISHSWDYDDEYRRMVELLDEANRFEWHNYSKPKDAPVETTSDAVLRRKLRNQIKKASVVVILGGLYVSHSDWIQTEIDMAERRNEPIVGVRPWGNDSTPSAVRQSADKLENWNTSSITDAIRDVAP